MSLPEKNSRRDFLKFGALAGVGLGLSALPSAEAAPDPKALKLLNAQDISATRPRPEPQTARQIPTPETASHAQRPRRRDSPTASLAPAAA